MRAEAWAPRWVALLGAVLLSTGCVTLAPRQAGSIAEGPRALSMSREAGASTTALATPSPLVSTEAGEHAHSAEQGEQERLHRRRGARGLGPDAALASAGEVASAGAATQGPPGRGGQAVPPGWPDFSDDDAEALLAPFLTCTSPGEFVALQDRVDMPRLVEALDDWRAVRLGALGPVREDAALLLQRKRAAFLVSATERYGVFYAEVFALFVLHSAYDDEVDEVLRLLAGDKQLGQTLGYMPAVHEELERRGMPLSRYPDRAEGGWDSLRGLGRAAWDVLSTSPTIDGLLYSELARYIQASREAGRLVATGGADTALALYEARGNVARARPLMSKAKPGSSGSPPSKSGAGAGKAAAAEDEAARPSAKKAPATEGPGTLASLVDEGVGHTREVVTARLAAAELEATGPRLPKGGAVLEKHRPSLEAPPSEARGNPRWREYVEYYNERFREVEQGKASKGPLKWEGYEKLRGWFARGLAFERDMVRLLKEDAQKPRAERRFLGDFDRPSIEIQVGVRKPGTGLRFADVLVIEEGGVGGGPRRVETFSFKSRNLSGLDPKALKAQIIEDANEALRKYGERLDIRRDSLKSLFPEDGKVPVQRVRLIYEGGDLKPKDVKLLKTAVTEAKNAVPGVEVVFQ